MNHRKDIDGLRAIAVIPVVLFHAGFSLFSGGFIGVDIFFVISGYLITSILIHEIETENFSILRFYERRIRRIFPALFIILLVTTIVSWFCLLPLDLKFYSQGIASLAVFASNFVFWYKTDYFSPSAEGNPLIHTWSLSIEEQFYLLFPLLLYITWRINKQLVFPVLLILLISSIGLAQYLSTASPVANFYLLPSHAWELLLGAIAAFYVKNTSNKHSIATKNCASLLGFLLILTAIFYFDKKTPSPSLLTLIPTIGTILIIVFHSTNSIVNKILSNRILVGLGLISYSLYLLHQPVFAFIRYHSQNKPDSFLLLIVIFVLIVVAYLSWKFIEQPFRNKNYLSTKQIFGLAIAGSILWGGFGLTGHITNGYENRLKPEEREQALFGKIDIYKEYNNSCLKKLGHLPVTDEVCVTTSSSPKTLFVGDSHAMALFSSIYRRQSTLNSMLVAGNSCASYPNLTEPPSIDRYSNCSPISKNALKIAKELPSIDTVVISNIIPLLDSNSSSYYLNGKNLTNIEAFRIGLRHFIKEMLDKGKKVVFFIDVPNLKHDPRKCLQNLPFGLLNLKCTLSRDDLNSERELYYKEINNLKKTHPNLIIYNPIELFCDNKACKFKQFNTLLYYDDNHISISGSKLILDEMLYLNILK